MIKKYITFVLGGFMGAAIGWGLTYYLTEVLKTWYLLSYSLSMAVPFTFKIIYHKMVTFKENKMNTATVLKYLAVYVFIVLLNILLVYIATSIFHIYYMISIFCATAILSIVNFALNKIYVFSEIEAVPCKTR
jgi:putative flippase GtrA